MKERTKAMIARVKERWVTHVCDERQLKVSKLAQVEREEWKNQIG